MFTIARAVHESDRTPTRLRGQCIKRLRLVGFGELRVVPGLELRPPRRVVAEPLAELGARAEISCPRVEPQRLLRASALETLGSVVALTQSARAAGNSCVLAGEEGFEPSIS